MRNYRSTVGLVFLAFLISACAQVEASNPTPTEASKPPTSTVEPTEVQPQISSEGETLKAVEETPTA
ncbi:MAG: hypothetical protein PVG32_21045, partial [Anaerolineales bacterium]